MHAILDVKAKRLQSTYGTRHPRTESNHADDTKPLVMETLSTTKRTSLNSCIPMSTN